MFFREFDNKLTILRYLFRVFLNEIRYWLTRRSGSPQASLKIPQDRSFAVIYLARGHTEAEHESIGRFLESYKKYKAGLIHNLYVIYKGFETDSSREQARESFTAPHTAILLPDENLDLGAFSEASRLIGDDYILLLNTHSEIRRDKWLEKIMRPLLDESIGLVGCTASFESLAPLSPLFPYSPNPHLRTNAIALSRTIFAEMTRDAKVTSKFDAWLVESGPHSLTNRIKSQDKRCVVVDIDGRVFDEKAWLGSGVFRHLLRQSALIVDNQIREFNSSTLSQRVKMSFSAWGAELIARNRS